MLGSGMDGVRASHDSVGSNEINRWLVFYSLEAWDEVWRRNQFVVDLLLRRHADLSVLFVAPPRNPVRRVTRASGCHGGEPRQVPGYSGRLWTVQPVRLPAERLPGVRSLNNLWQVWSLREWRRGLGIGDDAVLWINDHCRAHLLDGGMRGRVIYDITDDWTAMASSKRSREKITRCDAMLCRHADATIVCSSRLSELKSGLVPQGRLHLIPNGVHAEHYAQQPERDFCVPEAAKAWQRPVLGYTGTVHRDRVDVAFVGSVAERMTDGVIAFVGPNHLSEVERRSLESTGRVVFHPPVAYEALPALMSVFDLMFVPHRRSPDRKSVV